MRLLSIFLITLISAQVHAQCTTNITVTASAPYSENFESGPGNWFSPASGASDWAWGTPAKSVINTAASGVSCWVVGGLTGSTYNSNENSYLVSPCFDISSLKNPYISVNVFWESEPNFDGTNLQYSVNGVDWKILGTKNDNGCRMMNWFNGSVRFLTNPGGAGNSQDGWSGATAGSCASGNGSGGWVLGEHTLNYTSFPDLVNATNLQFRFNFAAGTTCNGYNGFAMDDFFIGEQPAGPVVDKITGDTSLCIRTQTAAQLNDNTTSGVWSTSAASIADVDNTGLITAKSAGTAVISYAVSSGSCTTTITQGVKVQDFKVSLTATPTFVRKGQTVTLKSTANDAYHITSWEPAGLFANNAPTQVVTPVDAETTYQVDAESELGCPDTASLKITLITPGWYPFVPNAFTPNNDSKNEQLKFFGTGIVSAIFNVYDQWGNLVFTTTDKNKGWDGQSKGKNAPVGVYAYFLKALMQDGTTLVKRGTLTLIR